MTPRDLLREWLELSENRALSFLTYGEERARIVAAMFQCGWSKEGSLLWRWFDLDRWQSKEDEPSHTQDPEAYWTARKALERETREYLEKGDA